MMISVPFGSDSFVSPRLMSVFGVPVSIIHSSTEPSAFFTST